MTDFIKNQVFLKIKNNQALEMLLEFLSGTIPSSDKIHKAHAGEIYIFYTTDERK